MTQPSDPRWIGVAAPGLPRDLVELDSYTLAAGETPDVVTWYESWWWKRKFADIVPQLDAIVARGITPQLTWEPWDPAAVDKVNQPNFQLKKLFVNDPTLGVPKWDSYVREWARAIKTWGKPLRIRFAHEMNGTWYPWAEGVNGNQPGDYVKAWWHVRGIFDSEGVTNVKWIWCVQAHYPGLPDMAPLYPGDVGVDEVAIDGYNWWMKNGDLWNSFDGVFRTTIEKILPTFTKRPISIGETGCPEDLAMPTRKAEWVRQMWGILVTTWPQIRGVLWFNFKKEADWRVQSSPAAQQAWRDGVW